MVSSRASFSRMMRKVLKGIQNVDNFVDDILIFTDTLRVKVLDQVLDRSAGAGLTAKAIEMFYRLPSVIIFGSYDRSR
jgi:hypothetical protein